MREASSPRAPAQAAALQPGTISDAAEAILIDQGTSARLTDLGIALQSAAKLLRLEEAAALFRALAHDPGSDRSGANGGHGSCAYDASHDLDPMLVVESVKCGGGVSTI
jgi:hypothetical protein